MQKLAFTTFPDSRTVPKRSPKALLGQSVRAAWTSFLFGLAWIVALCRERDPKGATLWFQRASVLAMVALAVVVCRYPVVGAAIAVPIIILGVIEEFMAPPF